MTTTEAPLDRKKLSEFEPHEVSATGTSSSSISSYAIPISVGMTTLRDGKVTRIEFRYAADSRQTEPVLIDKTHNPAISVAFSEGVRRVMRVEFFPPIEFDRVRLIAPRLREFARAEKITGKRFSLQLVADIVESQIFLIPPAALVSGGAQPTGATPTTGGSARPEITDRSPLR